MKDIGFGVIDRHSVIGILITMVLAQVLFGFQLPVDTSNASQLFIDLIVLTGYLYIARSVYRLPIAAPASLTLVRIYLFREILRLAREHHKYKPLGTTSTSPNRICRKRRLEA